MDVTLILVAATGASIRYSHKDLGVAMQRSIPSKRPVVPESVISLKSLFSRVEDHALFLLEEIKRIETFEARTFIYRQSERADSVYVLLEGVCVLAQPGSEGRTIRHGAICGLLDVLSTVRYSEDLLTVTPCICSVVGRLDLIEFLRKEPAVSLKLARVIGRDYRLLTQWFRGD